MCKSWNSPLTCKVFVQSEKVQNVRRHRIYLIRKISQIMQSSMGSDENRSTNSKTWGFHKRSKLMNLRVKTPRFWVVNLKRQREVHQRQKITDRSPGCEIILLRQWFLLSLSLLISQYSRVFSAILGDTARGKLALFAVRFRSFFLVWDVHLGRGLY